MSHDFDSCSETYIHDFILYDRITLYTKTVFSQFYIGEEKERKDTSLLHTQYQLLMGITILAR